MGVSLTRFTDPGLNLVIYRDAIPREELLDFFHRLDGDDPANASPWLSFFDPRADISELDLMVFVELKRILTPKLKAMAPDAPLVSAFVCDSRMNAVILNLWRSYVGRDPEYQSEPTVFTSLEAAFNFLGLPTDAHATLAQAVRAKAA